MSIGTPVMAESAGGIHVEIAGQDGGVERLYESVSTRGRRRGRGREHTTRDSW